MVFYAYYRSELGFFLVLNNRNRNVQQKIHFLLQFTYRGNEWKGKKSINTDGEELSEWIFSSVKEKETLYMVATIFFTF